MAIFLRRLWRGQLHGLVVLTLLAVAGCAGGVKKVTVRGTISYQGQPLHSGLLRLLGSDGSFSGGVIQPDGTFAVTDVVPGEVSVGVLETPQSSGSSSGEKSVPGPKPVALPEKFREPETSGVKYTITPQTTELAIELK